MQIQDIEKSEEILPTKQYNELGDPRPGVLNWFIGLLLLGSVLWGLQVGRSASTGLRFARLQDEFSRDKASVARLLTMPRFKPLFAQHAKLIRKIHPLFSMIAEGELGRALKMLDREETPKHPLLHVMAGRLRAIASDDQLLHRIIQQQDYFEGTEPKIWARYVDLRVKASHLLQARAASASDESYEFYEEGVLRGLPRLAGIPDGLPSVESVFGFVTGLRNAPVSQRRHAESALNELRETGLMLQSEVLSRMAAKTERQRALNDLEGRHRKARREARYLARHFAVELTRQSFPLEVRKYYSLLKTLMIRFNTFLPELLIEEHAETISETEITAALDSQLSDDSNDEDY